jgi:hypothetical protein
MVLTAFTLFHVLLSLVGIGSGFIVVYGLLTSKRCAGAQSTCADSVRAAIPDRASDRSVVFYGAGNLRRNQVPRRIARHSLNEVVLRAGSAGVFTLLSYDEKISSR